MGQTDNLKMQEVFDSFIDKLELFCISAKRHIVSIFIMFNEMAATHRFVPREEVLRLEDEGLYFLYKILSFLICRVFFSVWGS